MRAARQTARPRDLARRRGGRLGARARGARAPHRRAARRRPGDRVAARRQRRRPLARDRERFEALHAERRPLYDAARRRDPRPTPRARSCAAPYPRSCALAHAPAGTRMLWARSASGDYPVYVGDGVLTAPRGLRGRAFLVTDETVGPLYAAARRGGRRVARGPARARRPRRGSRPATCCAGWPPRGWRTTTTWSRSAAASSATSPASAPPPTSAACPVVQAADDARRAGRLGVRRQDRRRPARGQELRGRLPPAGGRARRPVRAGHAPAARSSRPAGPRWSRPR